MWDRVCGCESECMCVIRSVCVPECLHVSLSVCMWARVYVVSLIVCVNTTCWTPSEEVRRSTGCPGTRALLCLVLKCIYFCLCVYCRYPKRPEKGVRCPEATTMSHPVGVLGSQLQSSATTASVLNYWAISPAPDMNFKVTSRLEV